MLKFLGSGNAFNTKQGNTSAYDIIGSELLLIDCGEDVFEKVISKNLLEDITRVNIFITHPHSDHIGSLGTLIFYLYYMKFEQDKSKINVYFPTDTLKTILKLTGVTEDFYTYYVNKWDNLYPDGCNNVIEYEFRDCTHSAELENNTFSIAFYDKKGETFYYSGDTNRYEEVIKNVYAYDYICHEVSFVKEATAHLYYEDLLEAVKNVSKEDRKRIILMHLDADYDEKRILEDGFSIAKCE